MELPIPDAVLAEASAADVPEILVLQRCCWVTEALLNDSLAIPALHEDLDVVAAWVQAQRVWTVRLAGRLVGAVRAYREGDSWEIGRLMVAPDLRGSGLGRFLLETAMAAAPEGVTQLALFTGARSERNIRMYEAAGFVLTPLAGPPLGHLAPAVFLTRPVSSRA
jgi:GNAT superfamily N-acetyltransferase